MAAKQSRVGISHVTVVPANYDPETDDVDDANEADADTTGSGRKFT